MKTLPIKGNPKEPKAWNPLFDLMESIYNLGLSEWVPTTDKMYHYMLTVLPPVRQDGLSFLVGEAWNHTSGGEPVYAAFCIHRGVFLAKYLTKRQYEKIFI